MIASIDRTAEAIRKHRQTGDHYAVVRVEDYEDRVLIVIPVTEIEEYEHWEPRLIFTTEDLG